MFSIGDIYSRLKQFKEGLMPDERRAPLYFVKVDVQSAFDTIPQAAVTELMSSIPSQEQYTVAKHVEMHPGERIASKRGASASKPTRRWQSNAMRQGDSTGLVARLEGGLADRKRDTLFIDTAMRKTHRKADLLRLLDDHINNNLVRIGKKYYRQKTGIPQGSVLSSFLCNYFYADLERRHLDFLNGRDSLLFRLIDDFLLITRDKDKAVRFAHTMHKGFPEYGVEVSLKKTLVNFDITIHETLAPQIPEGGKFPYCGTMIDCQTLEITKDRDRGNDIRKSLGQVPDTTRS
jgi:telomerase reverse transcriptase